MLVLLFHFLDDENIATKNSVFEINKLSHLLFCLIEFFIFKKLN